MGFNPHLINHEIENSELMPQTNAPTMTKHNSEANLNSLTVSGLITCGFIYPRQGALREGECREGEAIVVIVGTVGDRDIQGGQKRDKQRSRGDPRPSVGCHIEI